MKRVSITLACLLPMLAIGITAPATAQMPSTEEIRQCVNKKRDAYRDLQPFSVEAKADCPQAYLYTNFGEGVYVPQCRSDQRGAPLSYRAPQGRRVVSFSLQELSKSGEGENGVHQPPQEVKESGQVVEARTSVFCKAAVKCPGGPGAWSHYRMSGTSEKIYNDDNVLSWTIECATRK